MKNKALELDLRQIRQGLEEFATFMSYQSNYEGLRILKVETQHNEEHPVSDNVVSIENARSQRDDYIQSIPAKNYR
ncbi:MULTISPECIES: hypothetical protein [Methylophaga]|jgi:hypothetical protein|uniref:Uncharacterized protein n=1 Tax=Methylophaga muralis TaxID=291169 RepID=A0A1E3GPX6_9GAMM|nr:MULTISPECIES: hypothetical protein [Methylophaga]ODN66067.1 hypothetical protein A9E74_02232 [Methylophaga muralis]THK40950.1 hypothetical protein E8Q33_10410 [Methylophaga sp. SB9B]